MDLHDPAPANVDKAAADATRPADSESTLPPPEKDASEPVAPVATKVQRVPPRRGRQPQLILGLPLPAAIGIVVGLLVLTVLVFSYLRWSARAAAETAARNARQAAEQVERDNQARVEAEQRLQAERQRLAEEQERVRLERIREQERQTAEAERAVVNDAERKERAWLAYYRKPPGCADAATMECTNHYIRARRAFEATYAKGQP